VARPPNSAEFVHSLRYLSFFLLHDIQFLPSNAIQHELHNSVAPSTGRISQSYSRGKLSGVTPCEVRVMYIALPAKETNQEEKKVNWTETTMIDGYWISPTRSILAHGKRGHLISMCISIRGNGVQNSLARWCDSSVFFFWSLGLFFFLGGGGDSLLLDSIGIYWRLSYILSYYLFFHTGTETPDDRLLRPAVALFLMRSRL
jgi:hypothetical protein